MKADFSGYATKNDLQCSDGRVIKAGAFAHQDKTQVPLVWQHGHGEPTNVLGHAVLENRKDGVYAYGFFNETPAGQTAKSLVQHKDINALSIYATQLSQQGKNVTHGNLTEVSLVLAGANPGAFIDNINLQHGETYETLDDEAIIYTGLTLSHSDLDVTEEKEEEEIEPSADVEKTDEGEELTHADKAGDTVAPTATDAKAKSPDNKTLADVYATLTPEQLDVVHYMLGEALKNANDSEDKKPAEKETAQHSETEGDALAHFQEGFTMARNVFEQNNNDSKASQQKVLSHSQISTIFQDAQSLGSLKESVLAHADEYGIQDVNLLFPEVGLLNNTPDFLKRRTEWVAKVLDSVKHSPFTRIKSLVADITADEARAKGYIKGNLKKDEVIKMLRRVTQPTTVYKKQKMDRDDILDITDFNVVTWLQGEMRLMLDEELARAILVGDGRAADDDDKIDEDKLRPIAYDIDLYTTSVTLDPSATPLSIVDTIVESMRYYRGTGQPTFYTTLASLTSLLLQKDTLNRRLYPSIADLANAMLVSEIVAVEAMETSSDIYGIIVNLTDYTVGADKGGEINMFDFFDIDYNQQKYLIETRVSGTLTKPKSAVVIKVDPGTAVTPTSPSFNGTTNVITIPTVAGVDYYVGSDILGGPATTGTVTITENTDVEARPTAGHSFPKDTIQSWTFTYTPAS